MVPNDKFLFPDTDIKTLSTRIGPAPVCEGKTFCEEVSDYPLDIVDAAIRNDQKLQNYDNTDAVRIVVEELKMLELFDFI